MTDQRISTEEAERIADDIEDEIGEYAIPECVSRAADALRSLAAERDALKNETSVVVCGSEHARRWLAMTDGCPMCLLDENERLAAERDALREAMETATDCCARATACGRILRDALGENQP